MVSVYMVHGYMTQTQHRCLTSGLSWDCVQETDFVAWKTPAHCLQAAVHDILETVKTTKKN